MRQMLCFAAFAFAALGSVGTAEAGLLGGGGCGGGHRHHHTGGGCSTGGCGSATGGCGSAMGGYAGGCASGYCTIGGAPGYMGKVAVVDGPRTATMVVTLPADARLLIDGQATRSESARRVFETPALETGKEFYYTLQAQVIRDGKTEVITQRVLVRAGENTEVRLDLPATSVAAR